MVAHLSELEAFNVTSPHHTSPGFWWFDVQGWPPGPNDRLHWAAKSRANRKCADQVLWQLKTCKPPKPLQRVAITMILYRKGGKPCDFDNAVARIKCLQDALVTGGLVVDDGPDHVTLDVQQQFLRGSRSIRIEVHEVKEVP